MNEYLLVIVFEGIAIIPDEAEWHLTQQAARDAGADLERICTKNKIRTMLVCRSKE